jgi:hypothetical protein
VSGNGFNATTAQNPRTNTRYLNLNRGGVDRFFVTILGGHVFADCVTRGNGYVMQTE